MEINENTLSFACNYFRKELENIYTTSELNQILHITFLHYFNLSRIDLSLDRDKILSEIDFQKITYVIKELKTNKPLAQIIGEWEFYGLKFEINKHILVPRPETEELVQVIINDNENKESLSILDIGTGSGCIAITLKKHLPTSNITAWDISEEALLIAQKNADLNNVELKFDRVDILTHNKVDKSKGYDIIVSNPPYITENEKSEMHVNVLDYDPHLALFVKNEEPLVFYNAIANFSLNQLNKYGRLYFEINEKYGKEVLQLLNVKGLINVNLIKDTNGKDRIVKATLVN